MVCVDPQKKEPLPSDSSPTGSAKPEPVPLRPRQWGFPSDRFQRFFATYQKDKGNEQEDAKRFLERLKASGGPSYLSTRTFAVSLANETIGILAMSKLAACFGFTAIEFSDELAKAKYGRPTELSNEQLADSKTSLTGRWIGKLFPTKETSNAPYLKGDLFVIQRDQEKLSAVFCYEKLTGSVRISTGADTLLMVKEIDGVEGWIFQRWAHQQTAERDPKRRGQDIKNLHYYCWTISRINNKGKFIRLQVEIDRRTSLNQVNSVKSPKRSTWKGVLSLQDE